MLANAGITHLPNADSNLLISYAIPGSGSATTCGRYSASSGTFVAVSGYTQSTCVVPGTLILVQLTYTYPFTTPLFSTMYAGGVPIRTQASVVEET